MRGAGGGLVIRRLVVGGWLLTALAAPPAGAGTIAGQVVFQGEVPRSIRVPVVKDHHACGHLAPADALLVSPATRGVANTVVWLEGVAPAEARPGGPAEVHLENRECRFAPHVLTARVGDELVVTNRDPVLHNLRAWLPERRAVLDVVQPDEGQVSRRPLRRAGILTLTCDTHVHMRGFLLVFEHAHHALTDAAGAFRIPDVPAGTYRLTAWHEGWTIVGREGNGGVVWAPPRVLTREVVVPAEGEVRVELELTP